MIGFAIALGLHLIGVVWWIGGLSFVTAVIIPGLAVEAEPGQVFARVERRFAPQARIAVLLVGATGLYMLWWLDAWSWFSRGGFWWLDLMVAYWLGFALLLFVVEPLGLMSRVLGANRDAGRFQRRVLRVHLVLVAVGLFVIGAAVVGARGLGG